MHIVEANDWKDAATTPKCDEAAELRLARHMAIALDAIVS
jgi:hypothetical protein